MKGKIESGQLCTVAPVEEDELQKGDIVLCKVNGSQYLHLIKAIQGKRFQIGNNIGRINGWITFQSIYGKLIQVEPDLLRAEPEPLINHFRIRDAWERQAC